MKLYETKKLHYGKYFYKLAIVNCCASYFRTEFQRDGSLKYARRKLDNVNKHYMPNDYDWKVEIPVTPSYNDVIPVEHFWDAIDIYRHLLKHTDYKIRCESQHLLIYSNNRKMLVDLGNKLRQKYIEFWEPNPETIQALSSEKNVIIVNKPPQYEYKVTLGNKKGVAALARWIEHNPKLASMGTRARESCKNENYVYGYYFYVRDIKTLLIIQMMAGDNILRTDKFVYIKQ